MYAILETGGKQIKAMPGQCIDIEKLYGNKGEKGEKISLNNVLMVVSPESSKIGNPFLKGAKVNGQIIEQKKGDKVIVYKMRPKKGTRKKQGHRQWYTKVLIESIELDGKVITAKETQKKEQKQEKK